MLLNVVSLAQTVALLAAFWFLVSSSLYGSRAMLVVLAILIADQLVSELVTRVALRRVGASIRPKPLPRRLTLALLDGAAMLCLAAGLVPWRHPLDRADHALIALGFAILGVRAFLATRS